MGSGANEVVKRILYGIGGSEEVVQTWREWWRLVATWPVTADELEATAA